MKTLLIGNGINIQYAKNDISNRGIILNSIDNIKKDRLNKEIVIDDPNLLLSLFGMLFRQVSSILEGEYIDVLITSKDHISYEKFLTDYKHKKTIRIIDIGFEDYFFIFELMIRKNKINRKQAYDVMKTLERLFIDAIYNNGKVNEIYKDYPLGLKEFFALFDNIFTTNYDKNISIFIDKEINYLHGAFHITDQIYNPNSLRNLLKDAPLKRIEVNKEYMHLYSNCITTYSGDNKLFAIKQGKLANEAIEKFARGYKNNVNIKNEINSFLNCDNQILMNLAESTKLKLENKELKFIDNYPIAKFEQIEGILYIVGLAPNNDIHIFEMIDKNLKINKVFYYYYSSNQNEEVRKMLKNKDVEFKSVKKLWDTYK